MISKVLCVVVLVAFVAAQHGHQEEHGHGYSSQSIHRHDGHAEKIVFKIKDKHGHEYESFDYRGHPKYEYKYQVEDKHTGDIKSQHETRDGDHVKGYYELKDPTGHVRHVDYESEKKTGFQASVKHDTHHVVPEHHHHH